MNQKDVVPMYATGIRIPIDLKESLQEIAILERRKTSDCIRIAIEDYVVKKQSEYNIKGS